MGQSDGGEAKAEEKMETSNEAKPEEKKEEKKEVKMVKKKKTVNKTVDLPVSQRVNGQLSSERLQAAITEENSMNNQDRAEADRLVAKNNVEEYIYDIRGKLCEELEEFMLEDDRNKYSLELEDAENWLYEDGEFDQRPEAINQFGRCLQLAQKVVDAHKEGDEKYNHLDVAEVEKVKKSIQEKQDWFNKMCADIQKLEKTSDPPVLAAQFMQEKDQFWQMASKILNKPKPKVEPPPPPPADSAPKEESKEASSDNKTSENGDSKPAEPGEMDVD